VCRDLSRLHPVISAHFHDLMYRLQTILYMLTQSLDTLPRFFGRLHFRDVAVMMPELPCEREVTMGRQSSGQVKCLLKISFFF
jgi:hypothetical protein